MSIELLAPVGDSKAFYSAIDNGADAVYLGVGSFNARQKAQNFSVDNLSQYIDYAHLFGVKVFITVNILIKDEETQEFIDLVVACYNMGVDAFIIQDIGMASLIKEYIPNAVLHASTQMGVGDVYSAEYVKANLGIKRVVLPREADRKTIASMAGIDGLETEVFVHGALCVSFSGQCYLSSIATGNSGNRGLCLQPCRKLYKGLIDDNVVTQGYLLSTKDLCLLNEIGDLQSLNVTSAKIEGRMKRSEYVGGTVNIYRQAITSGNADDKDLIFLKKLYNRGGFCKGYYFNNRDIMYRFVQGHLGVTVGNVKYVAKKYITVLADTALDEGDCFKLVKQTETGSAVKPISIGNNQYTLKYQGNISRGDKLNITTDYNQLQGISNTPKRLAAVSMHCVMRIGELPVLTIKFNNISITVAGKERLHQANNEVDAQAFIKKSLSKTNGLPFEIKGITVECDNVYVILSKLNSLRMDAFNSLMEQINGMYKHSEEQITLQKFSILPTSPSSYGGIAVIDSEDKLFELNKRSINKVVFFPREYTSAVVDSFIKRAESVVKGMDIYLYIPPFMSQEDIRLIEDILQKNQINGAINSFTFIDYLQKQGRKIFAYNMNVFNSYSAQFLRDKGITEICLSKELSKQESKDIADRVSGVEFFVPVYGAYEVMTLNHCPIIEHFGIKCKQCKKSKFAYEDEFANRFELIPYTLNGCHFRVINGVVLNNICRFQGVNKIAPMYDFTMSQSEQIPIALSGATSSDMGTSGAFTRGTK